MRVSILSIGLLVVMAVVVCVLTRNSTPKFQNNGCPAKSALKRFSWAPEARKKVTFTDTVTMYPSMNGSKRDRYNPMLSIYLARNIREAKKHGGFKQLAQHSLATGWEK